MKKISIKLAKELSLIKWNALFNEEKPDFSMYSEKTQKELFYHFNCGFCLRHGYGENYVTDIVYACENCEFGKLAGKCYESTSLYEKYNKFNYDDQPQTISIICDIIKIIESIEEDEK